MLKTTLFTAAAILATPAAACTDVALVLLADISDSMSEEERAIQRQGCAAAFRHPDVVSAIIGGYCGAIQVTYVEYGTQPHMVVNWQRLDGVSSADQFASAILGADFPNVGYGTLTGIARAMEYAGKLLDGNEASRLVIDVSSDGPENVGGNVKAVRDKLTTGTPENNWREITINGLPIGQGVPYGMTVDELDQWYQENVIGGPGAFFIRANNIDDIERIVRHKLVMEIG